MNSSLGSYFVISIFLGKTTTTTKDYRVKVAELDGKKNTLMYPNLTLLFPRQESRYPEVSFFFFLDPLRAKGNHTPYSISGHRIKVPFVDQWEQRHMGFFLDTEPEYLHAK